MVVSWKIDKARNHFSFRTTERQKNFKIGEDSQLKTFTRLKVNKIKTRFLQKRSVGKVRKNSKLRPSKIEEIFQIFPTLGGKVLLKIDDQSLTNFKLANKQICEFLKNGRVLWKQMILKNITGKCIHYF